MATGLPIVSTNVGDVASMVAPKNGFLVVPNEAAALAAAAAKLLDDEKLRLTLGAANKARARAEFSQDRMFASYGMLFDELS